MREGSVPIVKDENKEKQQYHKFNQKFSRTNSELRTPIPWILFSQCTVAATEKHPTS